MSQQFRRKIKCAARREEKEFIKAKPNACVSCFGKIMTDIGK